MMNDFISEWMSPVIIVDCWLVLDMTFQSTWLKYNTHETGFFNLKTHLKVEKLYYKKKTINVQLLEEYVCCDDLISLVQI